ANVPRTARTPFSFPPPSYRPTVLPSVTLPSFPSIPTILSSRIPIPSAQSTIRRRRRRSPPPGTPPLTRRRANLNALNVPLPRSRTSSPLSSPPPSPVPPSPASSDSSDSSQGLPPRLIMSSVKAGDATVSQTSLKSVPFLNAGRITPAALLSWESACLQYFRHKEIAPEKQVAYVSGGLLDPRVQDWWMTNSGELEYLSFGNFMSRLRRTWLPPNWADKIVSALFASKQNDDESLEGYITDLEKQNVFLRGNPMRLDNNALRNLICASACEEVRLAAFRTEYRDILDYSAWKDAVIAFDQERLATRSRRFKEYEQFRAKSSTKTTFTAKTHTSSNTNSNAAASTSRKPGIGALTEDDRKVLREHKGCYKCRLINAGHHYKDCTNPYPSPDSYKTPAQQVASAAKAKTFTKKVAAVTMESDDENANPAVAAVRAISPLAATTGILDTSDESDDDSVRLSVLSSPHLTWSIHVESPAADAAPISALIDTGSPLVLIREDAVSRLQLRRRGLPSPIPLGNAFTSEGSVAKDWVKLRVRTLDSSYVSRSVRALVVPSLCSPVVLGTPFLSRNKLLVDLANRALWDPASARDLCSPSMPSPAVALPTRPRDRAAARAERRNDAHERLLLERAFLFTARRDVARQLKMETSTYDHDTPDPDPQVPDNTAEDAATKEVAVANAADQPVLDLNVPQGTAVIAAIRERVEELATLEQLKAEDAAIKTRYVDLFPDDIPHVNQLPTDVWHEINLKDANLTIVRRQYDCPKRYRDAWKTLLDQHISAGRLRPSSSPYASPSFLVPKSDPAALPRWVNDYRVLNDNTIPDVHPLPSIQEILSDCGRGKIWGKLDMTNSFFQTRVREEHIKYTAVTTPFGLYEWTVMPQGARNAPSTHQRRMFSALRQYIGSICHVYLDDIIIWSQTVEEHRRNVETILNALRKHSLFCSLKKTDLFCLDLHFLGHRISRAGIQPDGAKVEKIVNWPTPKSASEVRSFLGLVRYVASFLPRLAELTTVLNSLTTKEAEKDFVWSADHDRAFDAVKQLVLGHDCLTVIDHGNMGKNRIFVCTDASDFCTGAVLLFGPSLETARPVAFESAQLKAAEINYPVHEKELLAIVRALKKWRVDLLGVPFTVHTDHRTLENFTTQKHLSRRQARWQEFLGQYDYKIAYIRGEDNQAADALSRLTCDTVDPASLSPSCIAAIRLLDDALAGLNNVAAVPSLPRAAIPSGTLRVSSDPAWLTRIRDGYSHDRWCGRLLGLLADGQNDVFAQLAAGALDGKTGSGVRVAHGLLYVGERLVIPRVPELREGIFRLAHDALGHFGFDKSYAAIRESYFWPKMRHELETMYIPSCDACQRNKGETRRPRGPLHPLPVPDARCDSVAIDFVGPLPPDSGMDCIVTMTDRLGSEMRFVPCRTDMSAEDFAGLFFQHWYCENGLPTNIVSDRDKLFISKFWRALHKLMGVRLDMSSSYHPQTDGSSERTNKTVVQMLRYHVARNQTGWVRALPLIRFQLMSTVNASTGYSPFHLRHGRSPRIIPPITQRETTATAEATDADATASALEALRRLETDIMEAQDTLLMAKAAQVFFANRSRGTEHAYAAGDKVLLSTFHRRREYMQRGSHRVAKFMVRFDGPFTIAKAHPSTSSYTLDLPASMRIFPTFHGSLLRPYLENDNDAFPGRSFPEPGPVVTPDGEEEYFVERILDRRRVGRGWQYLVRWLGYNAGSDSWLPGREVEDLAALDVYLKEIGVEP
ncbi:Transposon Tf2-12 polyprotein, partial [Trametes pubescens]